MNDNMHDRELHDTRVALHFAQAKLAERDAQVDELKRQLERTQYDLESSWEQLRLLRSSASWKAGAALRRIRWIR